MFCCLAMPGNQQIISPYITSTRCFQNLIQCHDLRNIGISISPQREISMPPKEPTRHQLSSRLAYSQHTPTFLQKLKNKIAGAPDTSDEEFEDDGSGRPPIPRRPSIPVRPDDDPGSADEDDGDEKPQVVVLKEGKHLTAYEAEKIRREGRMVHRKLSSLFTSPIIRERVSTSSKPSAKGRLCWSDFKYHLQQRC